MRAQPSIWSLSVGLAVLLCVLCVATTPAVAEQSGKVRIQGSAINAKLSLMTKTGLTGTFDTGCFSLSPKPNEGDIISVEVAPPKSSGGWNTPQQHTFILTAANGKQQVDQYSMGSSSYTLYVTVAEATSCDGQHTWIILFTQEQKQGLGVV